VVAWGNNEYGQTIIPAGLTGVRAIAAGDGYTVALKEDGTVVAWGAGTSITGSWPEWGQSIVPAGLNGVKAIAAQVGHTVALKEDGTVVAWGWNDDGQTDVPEGLTGGIAIAAGGQHTVVLLGSEGCADTDYLEYNPDVTVHFQDSCKTLGVSKNFNKPEILDIQHNPFSNSLTITFPNSTANKSLSIYTLKGGLVKRFVNIGNIVTWNAKGSGVYYIRTVVDGKSIARKIVL
jgi:hypothetical protein